jgi:ATP-dependent exoDNAse (exonuclease V) beta subunit
VTLTDGDAARALGPADIAVLCRTRWQVDLVRKELNRRRVPSVAARAGGVFAAPAAEEWRRFLLAVEHPERSDYVRLAATTLLVGNTVTEVAAFTDEAVLDLRRKCAGGTICSSPRGCRRWSPPSTARPVSPPECSDSPTGSGP